MKPLWRLHGALFLALIVLLIAQGAIFAQALPRTGGHLVYALDDPYIHMAIAKNLAFHGMWGVSADAFSSASSSPLWTLLLAGCFKVFGNQEALPLLMNLVCASLTVVATDRLLRAHQVRPALAFMVQVGAIFLAPLAVLVFSGQEHILHTLLTLVFAGEAAHELASEERGRWPAWTLAGVAPLLVMARYEGLFLVFLVCLLLLARRRWAAAFALGFAALLPAAIFGAVSMSQGWYPVPNSVLMKGNLTRTLAGLLHGDPTSRAFFQSLIDLMGMAAFRQMLEAPHILFLFLGGCGVYALRANRRTGFWDPARLLVGLFVGTTLLHMQFARTGWFFRYEAYLVVFGLCAIAASLARWAAEAPAEDRVWPRRVAFALLALIPLIALSPRGVKAFSQTPAAMRNIYEQQYQMGLFVHRYYDGQAVLANDIGALAYLADIRCVDLVGLAHLGAAKARKEGRFDAAFMEQLARENGARIAIAYESWLVKWGGVPERWTRVGTWTNPDNVVLGTPPVSFYALDPSERGPLIDHLRAFSRHLPAGVTESGAYTGTATAAAGRSRTQSF